MYISTGILLTLMSGSIFAATSFNFNAENAQNNYDTLYITSGVFACKSGPSIDCKNYINSGDLNFPLTNNDAVNFIQQDLIPQINKNFLELSQTAGLYNFSPVYNSVQGIQFTFQKNGQPNKTCFIKIDQSNYTQGSTHNIPEDCS